jgi:hypothetical protein
MNIRQQKALALNGVNYPKHLQKKLNGLEISAEIAGFRANPRG